MEELLKRFEAMIDEIAQLKAYPDEVFDEYPDDGKRTIREIIIHLYFWDKHNAEEMVPQMVGGANLPPFPDHDEQGKEAYDRLRDQPNDVIIDKFIDMRRKVIEEVKEVSGDVEFSIGEGQRLFTIERFLEVFVKHDDHHLTQIKKALSKRG